MSSPSYPAALDSLANPGPTTETDDTGYELDIVISRLQNVAMAIEAKLGIGTGGPPASGAVLRRTATGGSGWGAAATGDIAANAVSRLALTYTTAADLHSGTALGAGTYVDIMANQSFSIVDPGSLVLLMVRGLAICSTPTGQTEYMLRPYVDNVLGVQMGGCVVPPSGVGNPFAGCGTQVLTGLASGAHTVRLAVVGTAGGGTFYLRGSGGFEHVSFNVVELMR